MNVLESPEGTDSDIIDEPLHASADHAFRQRLIAAVIVALVGAAILGLATEFTIMTLNQTRAQARWVRQNMVNLDTLDDVLNEAQNAQRGYLLTGNPALLQEYKQDAAKYPDLCTNTYNLLSDTDKSTLRSIKPQINREMQNLGDVLLVYHQAGLQAASTALKADMANSPDSGYDDVLRDIIASDKQQFTALVDLVNTENNNVFTLVTVLIVFELIVISSIIWTIMSERAPLIIAADALSEQNEELLDQHESLNSTNDQLEASLKRFESLFRGVPVACYFAGPDGEILEWNSASEALFGIPTSEAVQRTIYDTIVRPAGFSRMQSISDGVMSGQSFENVEWVCRTGEGREVEVMSNLIPLIGDNAQPIGVMTATIDMTERKAVERLKSEFVSTVSHELRTPLTSIRGALGLVCSGAVGALPEQVKKLCTIANSNTERLVRLINDLLDIEKIEEGGIAFRSVPFSVVEVVQNAIGSIKGYAEEYQVEIACEPANSDATLVSDPDRLMQVFHNVLSNAIKFSGAGKKVVVRTTVYQNSVRFAVEDHGCGIPEEFRSRIFGKFQQADSADTRKIGGTGLGLSISRAIMVRLNGRIWFDSGDKGTTFFFELPLQVGGQTNRSGDGAANALICEGDKNFVNSLLVVLSQQGIQAHVAYTAQHAKQLLYQETYDVLIMDAHLPDQNGLELLKDIRLQSATERLPVIIISSSSPHGLEAMKGESIVDWLRKPLDSSRFIDSVNQAISQNKRQGR